MVGTADAHIVVVDDEPDLREAVGDYLRGHGYAVSEVDGGAALRALMAERPVDLVLLDIRMPGEDGLSIARHLREQGPVGIIMLTANREPVDRVVGLEVGADDYLPKPFDMRELLARVRAVLRRFAIADTAPATMGATICFGRCRLDLDARTLTDAEGCDVPITAMEYDLLRVLARNPGRVMPRHLLLEQAHHMDMIPFDRSIDMRVGRLRRKIGDDPKRPRVIVTVRGEGYLFAPGGGTD